MKGNTSAAIAVVVLLGCYATSAQALQSLCNNSPENPSVVLGLLGAAAAGYPYALGRAKAFLKRKTRRDQPAD